MDFKDGNDLGNDVSGNGNHFSENNVTSSDQVLNDGPSLDSYFGTASNDALVGDATDNRIEGNDGDDLLEGGAGADTLDGGTGTDTASYAGSVSGVTVSLATGAGTGGDAQGDTLLNIENLTGSDSADSISGNNGDNLLTGGAGADVLDGGAGTDTASYAGSSAGVTFNLAAGTGVGGDAQGDTLSNIENVIGSANADVLTGDGNANDLDGGAGNDTLIGGAGGDTIDGGAGSDTVSYAGSSAGVTIDLAAATASGGDAASDTLTNIENITGSANVDTLTGDSNANVLNGGAGNDTISLGAGDDTVEFGVGSGTDTVTDDGFDGTSTDTLALLGSLDPNDVWFAQVGDDLQLDLLGSSDRLTLQGWFSSGSTSNGSYRGKRRRTR